MTNRFDITPDPDPVGTAYRTVLPDLLDTVLHTVKVCTGSVPHYLPAVVMRVELPGGRWPDDDQQRQSIIALGHAYRYLTTEADADWRLDFLDDKVRFTANIGRNPHGSTLDPGTPLLQIVFEQYLMVEHLDNHPDSLLADVVAIYRETAQ